MRACCGEVVKNEVFGKEFYYCRGCKKEVMDLSLGNVDEAPMSLKVSYYGQITQNTLGIKRPTPLIPTPATNGWPYNGLTQMPVTPTHNFGVISALAKQTTMATTIVGMNQPVALPSGTIVSFLIPHKHIKPLSLVDWIPHDRLWHTQFLGVDRSQSPSHLAGLYFKLVVAKSVEEYLIDASCLASSSGLAPTQYLLSPREYAGLFNSTPNVTGKCIIRHTSTLNIGGMSLSSPMGPMHIFPCDTIPDQVIYAIDASTWQYDPNFNLWCTAPGKNAVFSIK